jgi:hypothetical protein
LRFLFSRLRDLELELDELSLSLSLSLLEPICVGVGRAVRPDAWAFDLFPTKTKSGLHSHALLHRGQRREERGASTRKATRCRPRAVAHTGSMGHWAAVRALRGANGRLVGGGWGWGGFSGKEVAPAVGNASRSGAGKFGTMISLSFLRLFTPTYVLFRSCIESRRNGRQRTSHSALSHFRTARGDHTALPPHHRAAIPQSTCRSARVTTREALRSTQRARSRAGYRSWVTLYPEP